MNACGNGLQVAELHAKVLVAPKRIRPAVGQSEVSLSYEVQWQAASVCVPASKTVVFNRPGDLLSSTSVHLDETSLECDT